MVDLLLQAYLPSLSESLGVFIPLIVVNCIILGRAEAFASKHGVLESAADGLCQGIGYTAALVTEDNGEVWTDSCVEFFIAPDDSGYYYNFECTCIGRLLAGFRREREHATHATPRVMESILRNPSLGPRPFPEHEGDNRWSVVLAIPPQALFMHSLTDWSGLKAKVNLYKCGDKLSQPHFLSWKPIAAPKPDFHLPEFFEQIKFSKI